jgi:NAD(P)-dependent dehydrogenase (short-subunit alcohol dehydrogenase family)
VPSDPRELRPQRAIVTASDSGIGKATAVALAEAGMDVGITWHSDEKGAEETAEEVRSSGRQAFVARLDTNDLETCGDVVDTLVSQLGGLDVFVNNAGTGDNKPFLELTLEEWRHTVATDLDGAFVCLQRAARHLVQQGRGGRLIAVTGQTDEDPRGTERPGVPLGRPGFAYEIADVIAFLASPKASYVTGASWVVDGGMLQMGPQGGSHITSNEWREG